MPFPWLAAATLASGAMSYYGAKKANEANMDTQLQMAKHGLSWRIEDAKKHGIHPLAAIGASPGPMPTIPMQNEFAGLSRAFQNLPRPTNPIDERLKMYALEEAKRRAHDSQYDYELLIPVQHKDMPGQTLWAFNPRYLAYGTFATSVVMAANKDLALKMIEGQLENNEKSVLQDAINHFKKYNKQRKTKKLEAPAHPKVYDDYGGTP